MALDYAGVAVFAATGALAAARRGYDIITFAFFAAITGIGGGTLRDLLIGAPVFWVSDAGYIGVCIAMAGIVWALGERLERVRTLLWLDALGLAAYCVVGASKAADWGAPPLVAAGMGVLTATFGGVVRDVLAGEPSVLLRKEIYVTAAVGGAGLFVVARLVGAPDGLAAMLGVLAGFGLRAGALAWGWNLPGYGASLVTSPMPAVPITPPASLPLVVAAPPVTVGPPSPPEFPEITAAAKRATLSKSLKAQEPTPVVAARAPVIPPRKARASKPTPALSEQALAGAATTAKPEVAKPPRAHAETPPPKPRRPRTPKPKGG